MSDEMYLSQIRNALFDLNASGQSAAPSKDGGGSSGAATGAVIGSVFAALLLFVGIGAAVFVSFLPSNEDN